MTVRREPASLESLLMICLQVLPPAAFPEFTGAEADVFKKASNPNLTQQLALKYAPGLDVALVSYGHDPLFGPWLAHEHERLMTTRGHDARTNTHPAHRVMRIVKELGDLSAVVTRSLEDNEITPLERRQILKEAAEVQRAAAALVADMENHIADGSKKV